MGGLSVKEHFLVMGALFACFPLPTENRRGNLSHLFFTNELRGRFSFRIVGGRPAREQEYPFMASVRLNGDHVCGGTVLSRSQVLTAAHCTFDTNVFARERRYKRYDPKSLSVMVGSTQLGPGQGMERRVMRTRPHEQFNFDTMDSDVAILYLSYPLELGTMVKTVTIAQKFNPIAGMKCTAIGWGYARRLGKDQEVYGTSESGLRAVDLPLVSRDVCRKAYPTVTRQNLCTYTKNKDACVVWYTLLVGTAEAFPVRIFSVLTSRGKGDSGGPLLCGGKQVAIVSYGRGCAAKDLPGVHQRLDVLGKWLLAKSCGLQAVLATCLLCLLLLIFVR